MVTAEASFSGTTQSSEAEVAKQLRGTTMNAWKSEDKHDNHDKSWNNKVKGT